MLRGFNVDRLLSFVACYNISLHSFLCFDNFILAVTAETIDQSISHIYAYVL